MTAKEQNTILEKHERLRNILIDNGSEEYGDFIIDEICFLLDYPTTTDIADEEGKLYPVNGIEEFNLSKKQ